MSQLKIRLYQLLKHVQSLNQIKQIHAQIILQSLGATNNLIGALIQSYSAHKKLKSARNVFNKYPTLQPTFLWNLLIQAYTKTPFTEQSLHLFKQMLLVGGCHSLAVPDDYTFTFAITACARQRTVFSYGQNCHTMVIKLGYDSDVCVGNALVSMYVVYSEMVYARKVFDEMPQRDTVAWNVLVSCYTRNGRTRDALDVFDRMQRGEHGCDPDDVTCLLVLQACSNMCAFEFGERVHRYVKDHGYSHALNICNSLVAMYSKCGQLDKAYEVFQEIPNKDVVSWTAMISGFASNGRGREAINVFREMQRMGISPDEQTFTALLSGCSHSGLLDEGRSIFDRMQREFGLVPNIHHYGCVVDLMGRVGLVEDAYELIVSMNCKPDATIWRTLLGACKVHGNLTLGERVIERLIELKAQEAGDYILLLNIYSSAGNLEKVIELRKLMKEKGIQTTPSASTIELKGEIHEFKVDDTSHPRINEVYEILDEIEKQLKIGGYIAEITDVRLSYHSEKLAMAFGVLATPPGTKIRVAKDLRICTDCHNFAKMLSAVYSREVTIRDRTRFHHFREGRCSCNDFW